MDCIHVFEINNSQNLKTIQMMNMVLNYLLYTDNITELYTTLITE